MLGMLMVWLSVDPSKCSGCHKCEIVCSLRHEGRVWPEASRVRVFRLVPGAEFPHLCIQCKEHPCVDVCPVKALSVKGDAIMVGTTCIGCGKCVEACPGKVPHLHPATSKALICDLCGGEPECVRVCGEGGWKAIRRGGARMEPCTPEKQT